MEWLKRRLCIFRWIMDRLLALIFTPAFGIPQPFFRDETRAGRRETVDGR